MDSISGKTLVSFTDFIVKCGRYPMTMFIRLSDCRACPHHKGIVKIHDAVNNITEVNDVLCGVPVHRRIEYVVQEANDGSSQ